MAQDNIPKNQIKSRNTIEQREHEDDAAARRVVPVDQEGDFFGTVGNPIYVIPTIGPAASDPEIFNVDATLADTEYSQVLPDHTNAILIRVRDGEAKMQISFNVGETGTKFITVGLGNNFYVSGVDLVGKAIYFQASRAGKVVEILTWS